MAGKILFTSYIIIAILLGFIALDWRSAHIVAHLDERALAVGDKLGSLGMDTQGTYMFILSNESGETVFTDSFGPGEEGQGLPRPEFIFSKPGRYELLVVGVGEDFVSKKRDNSPLNLYWM